MTTTQLKDTTAAAASPDVPIFLRKTFHMIDTCDSAVASWSEDGETFVVKDPVKFESTIIPQFFKHSKFSSFVRQLNFYSFRKIKYTDTLRIDPKLEAQTANHWRFHHANFRRGRPDLLSEIKRMNSTTTKQQQPAAPASNAVPAAVDSEVQALKKRIEEMNKNIDQLTAMVEKVNLKQEEQEQEQQVVMMGNKRKKVLMTDPIPEPEQVASLPEPSPQPDVSSSSMAMDDLANLPLPPTLPLPDPAPLSTTREMTVESNATDNDFVDQLYSQFGDDDMEFLNLEEEPKPDNRPDPELMQRLSDALMVLPKEIQEMIVERLIQSITSPDFEKNIVLKASTATATPPPAPQVVAAEDASVEMMDKDKQREVAVPLAAATLAALLQHLCQHVQGGEKVPKTISKILPVVPVHA